MSILKESVHFSGIRIRLPAAVLLACLLLACFGGQVRADVHRVELKKELKQGSKASFNAKEQKKALSRAVVMEAEQILAGNLSEGRKKVVQKILRRRMDDFVLSYSEQQYLENGGDTGVLSLEVNVNTQSVKDELKKWGTYYTTFREWAYRLEVRGKLNRDKELQLADLEAMSGLRRDRAVMTPVLALHPPQSEGDHWKARLRRDGEDTVHVAESLEQVWLKSWSAFFSRKGVRLRVERKMQLTATGWSTTTGLRHFHSVLGGWSKRLDRAVLQSIGCDPGGVSGTWTVYTLTPMELRGGLRSYVSPRGLDFRLEVVNATRSSKNGTSSGKWAN